MQQLEFLLFGTFTVKVNGTDVTHFPTDKIRALLAYLALEPSRPHRREHLAGFFWPDVPQETALKNLRQSLYRLRRTLELAAPGTTGRLLRIAQQSIELVASEVAVDVQQFQRALVEFERHAQSDLAHSHLAHSHLAHSHLAHCDACLVRLQQALALYNGELLSGFGLADAPEFEEWLILRREMLHQQALIATDQLAQAFETKGTYEQAHRYASRQLALDPTREATYRRLMRLLAKRGLTHQALEQFEACRRMLRQEFGVEPEAETAALVEQIYAGNFSIQDTSERVRQKASANGMHEHAPEAQSTTPVAATSLASPPALLPLAPQLVGREQERQEITHRLLDAHCRLLTLTGPGGVGKTTLAIQAAIDLQAHFADGVYYVDLTTLLDPDLVLLSIAQTLGVHDNSVVSLPTRLKEVLHDKQLLLVLDNFEQVAAAAPQVAALPAACPRLKVLVTSRHVLHLRAEHVFTVEPLPLPTLQPLPDLESLAQVPAVAFFLLRARAALPTLTLTAANAQAVADLCVNLDGLPLAIELVAARLRLLPPQALLARLRSTFGARLNLLTSRAQDRPEHQQTLQRTIAWSYDLLSPHLQRLFARLALFVGGFTVEAAEAICGDAINNGDEGVPLATGVNHATQTNGRNSTAGGADLNALLELVDQSLLHQQMGVDSKPRLLMLETIREYALEQLVANGEYEEMQQRHLLYYLALAEASGLYADRPKMIERLQLLEAEHGNMRAALAWSMEQMREPEIALRLSRMLASFWYYRGYWQEGRQLLERALASTRASAITSTRAHVNVRLAEIAFGQGDFGVARDALEESLAHFRQVRDPDGIASTLSVLGLVLREQGDAVAAQAIIEESLARFREHGGQASIPWCLCSLGEVLMMQGNAQQARSVLEEGLALFGNLGDQIGIGWVYNHLGHVAQLEKQYTQAFALHEASLSYLRQRDSNGVAWGLSSLGQIAYAQGKLELALSHYMASLRLFQELGSRQGVAWCLAGIAGVASSGGQPERAAWLWGFVETLCARDRGRPAPGCPDYEAEAMAATRAQLDDKLFEQAWRAGAAASLEAALNYATTQPLLS